MDWSNVEYVWLLIGALVIGVGYTSKEQNLPFFDKLRETYTQDSIDAFAGAIQKPAYVFGFGAMVSAFRLDDRITTVGLMLSILGVILLALQVKLLKRR